MITHPGRDVLLGHVDGELPDHEERAVAAHAATCEQCTFAVAAIRDSAQLFAGVLLAIDDDEPAAWSASTRDHDGYHGDERKRVVPLRRENPRAAPTPSRASSAFRWAAGIVLVSVAGVSAAIVGYRMQAEPQIELIVPATAADAQVEPGVASLVMTPQDGMLRVALSGAGAGTRVYVTLVAGAAARIAVEGAESPRFTAVPGRVDVDLGADIATVRVTLPSTLRETIVTAAGSALVTIRQDSVSPAAAATTGILLDAASQPRTK